MKAVLLLLTFILFAGCIHAGSKPAEEKHSEISPEELVSHTLPLEYRLISLEKAGEVAGVLIKAEVETPEGFKIEKLFLVTEQGKVFVPVEPTTRDRNLTAEESHVEENLPRFSPLPREGGK